MLVDYEIALDHFALVIYAVLLRKVPSLAPGSNKLKPPVGTEDHLFKQKAT